MSDGAKGLLSLMLASLVVFAGAVALAFLAVDLGVERWMRRASDWVIFPLVFVGFFGALALQAFLGWKLQNWFYRLLGGDSWRGKYR